eukprot:Ihof_evm34s1 gene=Ihof_evmTU34s1
MEPPKSKSSLEPSRAKSMDPKLQVSSSTSSLGLVQKQYSATPQMGKKASFISMADNMSNLEVPSQIGKASDTSSTSRLPRIDFAATATPDMEGPLYKWTNYVRGHQKRYFVLQSNILSYYKNRSELHNVCKGSIYLGGVKITQLDSTNFYISTSSEAIYLRALDPLSCKRWLTALSMAQTSTDPPPEANRLSWTASTGTGVGGGDGGDGEDEYSDDDNETSDNEEEIDPVKFLQVKLDIVKKNRDVILRETAVMQATFSQAGTKNSSSSSSMKQVHKQGANLYTYYADNLVRSCEEYIADAELSVQHMNHILKKERNRREKLELTISQLARQHQRLEKKATIMIKHLANDDYTEAMAEDEDVFYDVPEEYGEEDLITPTPEPVMEQPAKSEPEALVKDQVEEVLGAGQFADLTPRNRITYRVDRSINYWSVLKNFIGRDLTKIPMPVAFNEPLSMLQRLAEDLEYTSILNKAAQCQTSQERLCYVAAFTASAYSTVISRTYKPFNPLLGETFELDMSHDPRYGWRSLAEQVSHHPPIAAMHTEADDWEMLQQFSMDSKFRGKYMSIVPTGISSVHFKKTGEKYTWTKVTTTVHNIIVGKLWIDQHGEMTITDHTTGDVCNLSYVPYSYFGREVPHKIKGTVADKTGKVHYVLEGTWDKSMAYWPVDQPEQRTTTWEVAALPPDSDKMYGFSYFACRLNQPMPNVAPTDSRLRPDQHALENQNYDLADEEKTRLEDLQRCARKAREEKHEHYSPRWFQPSVDQDTCQPMHQYNNEYWEAKKNGDWTGCPQIYAAPTSP